jgi:hypothetical protein
VPARLDEPRHSGAKSGLLDRNENAHPLFQALRLRRAENRAADGLRRPPPAMADRVERAIARSWHLPCGRDRSAQTNKCYDLVTHTRYVRYRRQSNILPTAGENRSSEAPSAGPGCEAATQSRTFHGRGGRPPQWTEWVREANPGPKKKAGTGPTAGETGPPVAAAVRATAGNPKNYSGPVSPRAPKFSCEGADPARNSSCGAPEEN